MSLSTLAGPAKSLLSKRERERVCVCVCVFSLVKRNNQLDYYSFSYSYNNVKIQITIHIERYYVQLEVRSISQSCYEFPRQASKVESRPSSR
jgi:hypothetical protein